MEWFFEDGGGVVRLKRAVCGTSKRAIWFFEEGGVVWHFRDGGVAL